LNETQDWKGQILGTNDVNETVKIKVDTTSKSLKTITTDHSDVHNKKGFSISGIFDAVADSTSVNYAFKTPTAESGKLIHLKYYDIQSTSPKVRTDFYEAPTNAPTLGTDINAYNHNRVGTPEISAMQAIKSGVTFDGTGVTMLNWQYIPNKIQPLDTEFILKPNTWYVRLFTNKSGSAVDLSFYEYWIEEQ
jgi:hypothetical protein